MDAEDRLARVEELRAAQRAGTLLELCDLILGNGISLNHHLAQGLASAGRPSQPTTLTPRQREVLNLLREGLAHKEVARRLFISVHTVRNHLADIYARAGVHNIAGALWAFRERS